MEWEKIPTNYGFSYLRHAQLKILDSRLLKMSILHRNLMWKSVDVYIDNRLNFINLISACCTKAATQSNVFPEYPKKSETICKENDFPTFCFEQFHIFSITLLWLAEWWKSRGNPRTFNPQYTPFVYSRHVWNKKICSSIRGSSELLQRKRNTTTLSLDGLTLSETSCGITSLSILNIKSTRQV